MNMTHAEKYLKQAKYCKPENFNNTAKKTSFVKYCIEFTDESKVVVVLSSMQKAGLKKSRFCNRIAKIGGLGYQEFGYKAKKLIRNKIAENINEHDLEVITDKEELNRLYRLKVMEELAEVVESNYSIEEFADLLHVVLCFAVANSVDFKEDLEKVMAKKREEKGIITNIALTSLDPKNPSNKIYFENNKPI